MIEAAKKKAAKKAEQDTQANRQGGRSIRKVVAKDEPVQKRVPPKSISIKDRSNKIDNPKGSAKSLVEEPVPKIGGEEGENKPFTQEELAEVWKEYLTSLEKTNIRLYSILSDKSPMVKDSNVVEISILQTQKTLVENEKSNMVSLLRSKLKNDSISLNLEVVKQEKGPQKAFTATDKFKLMIEKNPVLGEMKAKLGLDLD